tara:strand:+ start:180248 stop:181087 length:840 start_codon:yes stop_codon:yes gene_type:complete
MNMLRPTAIALLLAFSPLAHAQPADTLRGPQVERDQLDTIVITDMSGNFIPVEERPELVAFARVCDDPEDLARAREVGTSRVFDLAELLVDEIDTVRTITDAIAEGNTTYAQTLLAQLRLRHDPDMLRDPLRAELEPMLEATQRERFDRILDEYWDAWIAANTPESEQDMQGRPRTQAVHQRIENRLNNELFQRDIANAYEYSLRRYRDAMQAMYDAIQPTPEQRAWIRNRVIQHIKDTRLNPTLEQREALMLEIYDMLDEDRQTKLFLYMTRAAMTRG